MAVAWVVPFLAGIVAALFAAKVWGQWTVRRRPHQLAWASGLTLYAIATMIDAYVAFEGWNLVAYRVFFAVAAANVGLLGLGTVLLTRSGIGGRIFGVLVVIGCLVAALGQFAVPLEGVTLEGTAKLIPMSQPARISFLLLNILGGLALIGGALLSWWQTRQAGVLLIGVGALLPAMGGTLSSLGLVDTRVILQFLGILVMFIGYLRGREATPSQPAGALADG